MATDDTEFASSVINKHYQFLNRAFVFSRPVPQDVRSYLEADHTQNTTGGTPQTTLPSQTRAVNNLIFLFRILKSYRVSARSSTFLSDVAADLGGWSTPAVFEAQRQFVAARRLFLHQHATGARETGVRPVGSKLGLLSSLVDGWMVFDPSILSSEPVHPALWAQVRKDWKTIYLIDPHALLVDSDEFVRQQMASESGPVFATGELGVKEEHSDDEDEESISQESADAAASSSDETPPAHTDTIQQRKSPLKASAVKYAPIPGPPFVTNTSAATKIVYKAKRTPSGWQDPSRRPTGDACFPCSSQTSSSSDARYKFQSPLNTVREVIVAKPYA